MHLDGVKYAVIGVRRRVGHDCEHEGCGRRKRLGARVRGPAVSRLTAIIV